MSDKITNFLHKASSALAVLLGGLSLVQASAPVIPSGTSNVNTLVLWATAIFGALGHLGSVTTPSK